MDMDADLSHRLAWYFAYLQERDGILERDDRREMIKAAEKAGTLNKLPLRMQNNIMKAELSYSPQGLPAPGIPWPIRDKYYVPWPGLDE
ncbi:MAG: hypothetical protein ACOYBP_08595 [Microbacteriaceae bacterium]